MPRIVIGKPCDEESAILSFGDREIVLSATILHHINGMLATGAAGKFDTDTIAILNAFCDIGDDVLLASLGELPTV